MRRTRLPGSRKRPSGRAWACDMILRVVILFLIFIAVMAMIQKALRPRRPKRPALDRLRCPTCKRVHFSDTPNACGRQDCRYR